MNLSGIKHGPICPRIVPASGKGKDRREEHCAVPKSVKVEKGCIAWRAEDDKNVCMSYASLRDMLSKAFLIAGFGGARLYIIRKSATKWAARCNAVSWVIMAAGRWKESSRHFLRYIQSGILEGIDYSRDPREDPIRKIWVFKPTVTTPHMPQELRDSAPSMASVHG